MAETTRDHQEKDRDRMSRCLVEGDHDSFCFQNVSLLLAAAANTPHGLPPPSFSPKPLPHGGLKLAPFPPRARNESNTHEALINYMSEDQANELKNVIFSQLHEFSA
jgi:hypothetical protein